MSITSQKKTKNQWLIDAQQNGYALQHVPFKLKTKKLSLAAVKQNEEALQFVPSELKTASYAVHQALFFDDTKQ